MRDFLETGDTVDCVILDAVMPGEATASLLIYLKERGLPVIIISGNPDAIFGQTVPDDACIFACARG